MRQPGGQLLYLIINCHGIYRALGGGGKAPSGGYRLSLGKGLFNHNASLFSLLRSGDATSRPLVKNIMMTSCGTSAVSPENGRRDGNGKHEGCGGSTNGDRLRLSWILGTSATAVSVGSVAR
jgi:hypothetical protein